MTKGAVLSRSAKADKDPNKGALRIASKNIPVLKPKDTTLTDLLDTIATHKPNTGIIKRVMEAAKKGGMLQKVAINKAMALDLLSVNIENNRNLKWSHVMRYTAQMVNKKWQYAGENLIMNIDGKLLNGQKRLMAIYLSDTVQVFHLEGGFANGTLNVLDTGQARNAEDTLRIHGILGAPNTVAAAIKKIIRYRLANTVGGSIRNSEVTNLEVSDWIEKPSNQVKKLAEFIEIARNQFLLNADFLSASEWGFLWYILWKTPEREQAAEKFVRALATGNNISDSGYTSSIFILRNLLRNWENERLAGKIGLRKSGVYNLNLKFKYIIRAFNYFVDRVSVDEIKLDKEYRDTMIVEFPH